MILLDTSAFIEIAKRGKKSADLLAFLGDAEFSIPSIVLHEFRVGSDVHIDVPVIMHDEPAAEAGARVHRDLLARGQMIGGFDLLIAGICLANDATLVTCDAGFKKIKGLKVRVF